MKKFLLPVAALFVVVSFGSCKKCVECKAESGASGIASVKQEYCGNKSDRDAFESSWKATYSAAGYGDVKCD